MLLSSLIFISSLSILFFTYLGYPALINIMARFYPKRWQKQETYPTISVVMAVFNEGKHISSKLQNLCSINYPKDKLQIIVISDASEDETDELIESFVKYGVVYKRLDRRSGKPSALNVGMSFAKGEIIVFCDARQQIDTNAFRSLTLCFSDPKIGAVSGELFINSQKGPGIYWRYEKWIRKAESLFDSVPGATGALYAIRRDLYEPLPKDLLLDDVYTPMQIILKGYRVVLDQNAKAFDQEADHNSEFRRKSRTLAGNYQLINYLPEIMNPVKNRIFFQFFSHKILRLVCPAALAGMFISNFVLVFSFLPGSSFFVLPLLLQCVAYAFSLNGMLQKEKADKVSRTAYTFMLMNVAAVEGLRRYLKKDFSWTH